MTATRHAEEELGCACGHIFTRKDNLAAHARKCVTTREGARAAIKRRLDEISASDPMGDPYDTTAQVLRELKEEAERLTRRPRLKCSGCQICFTDKHNLNRHIRKFHHERRGL